MPYEKEKVILWLDDDMGYFSCGNIKYIGYITKIKSGVRKPLKKTDLSCAGITSQGRIPKSHTSRKN